MFLHVGGKILIRLDGLVTYFAIKSTQFVVLLIDVSPQRQLIGKLTLTNGASVLHALLMAFHVHAKIGIRRETGRAFGAVKLLYACLMVRHHMLL